MSIAFLNQTGLPTNFTYPSDFRPPNQTDSNRLDDLGRSTTTDQFARNASFVDRLPALEPPNTTDYARLLTGSRRASTHHKPVNLKSVTQITVTSHRPSSSSLHPPSLNDTTEKPSSSHPHSTANSSSHTSIQPLDNPLVYTILVAAFVLWNVYGFFIQIKLLFFTETKASTNQLYDNCTLSTSYFKYMVRLRYTSLIGGYQTNAATIMIDLLDTKDQFITRFTITPALFAENNRSRNKFTNGTKMIKLRLNRKNEFPEIGSLR